MKPSAELKQKLFTECLKILDERISQLTASLNDLTQGAESDAKSSAGDKHETARAMMQIEHGNLSHQLDELMKERNELAQTDISITSKIKKGSLIKTNHGNFFLAVALGKVMAENLTVIVLSPQSPLGGKLFGLSAGDAVDMNGVKYMIEEVG